ncbi:MAG: hypothetical protein AAB367_00150 [Patescibacteria group bacterium]
MPEEIWNLDDLEEEKPPARGKPRGLFLIVLVCFIAAVCLLFFVARWYGIELPSFDMLRSS